MFQLEESRVKLSQRVDTLQDQIKDKDTTISKLSMKIGSLESMANKPTATTNSSVGKERKESKGNIKQAVVPKALLREILQSSDKEVEGTELSLNIQKLRFKWEKKCCIFSLLVV